MAMEIELPDSYMEYIPQSVAPSKRRIHDEDMEEEDATYQIERRMIKRIKFPVQISVRTLGGRGLDIELDTSDRVGRIKERIEQMEGIPTKYQRLVHRGRNLEDIETLEEASITTSTEVYLVIALACNDGYNGVFQGHRDGE
eukprot:TRINITY_DN14862_c0_g1_i1.p1 TRINITY_DN14862_c0_g1~~TRINITY_DN14862_c0_g1_i1.p1  ORF type:complete len:142 (-),score=29.44 TRINITY_DN14862_c0_g1_i1:236-661(-)